MSKKKNGALVWIIAIVISVFICMPAIARLFSTKESNEPAEPVEEEFVVIDAMISWEQDAYSLNLVGGNIKTNKKVANVYVNVNGFGVEYLEFTANPVETDSDAYIAHVLKAREDILSAGFLNDVTLTVDVYVEYKQKSYKVNTQEVTILCAWTPNY